MPNLNPIQAIRFDTSQGNDISSKIAPPYDVLDEQPKQDLLARDSHNIVAIDLPVTPPKTVGPDTAYNTTGQTFNDWLASDILQRDASPSIVAYEQEYTVENQTFKRRGLFAALTVEEFNRKNGGIHRHELTIKAGTDDRLKLMQATRAQLSPIFGVFPDPNQTVTSLLDPYFQKSPDFYGTTKNDNVQHRCWLVTDPNTLTQLQTFFTPTDVFIADGHHRYTTALNYHKQNPTDQNNTCLFVLVACEDPGMIVLPTHRIITGLQDFSIDALTPHLANNHFTIQKVPTPDDFQAVVDEAANSGGHHPMLLDDPVTNNTYLIQTTNPDPLVTTHADRPDVWRTLDVAVLHHLFIDQVLRPNFGGDAIAFKYTADIPTMQSLTRDEPGRLGVVMRHTPLKSVCDVSLADDVMPPKSTYFYPKLATGLVINPLF